MSGTTGIVVFDYTAWVLRFPEFSGVSEELAQAYFDEACLIFANTPAWVGSDVKQRAILLNLLTAHIARLNGWPAPAGSGSTVSGGASQPGYLTSATEGSVSTGFQPLGGTSNNAMYAWLAQTQYGAEFWMLTAAYRMARYFPGRQPYLGVGPRYIGRGYWW